MVALYCKCNFSRLTVRLQKQAAEHDNYTKKACCLNGVN